MCSWRQRMVKVYEGQSQIWKSHSSSKKHLKSQQNIYSTTTTYIYLGKFIHHMTVNLFFITPRSPPLPLPLFQHPMTHDFRLLPEHTHDGFQRTFNDDDLSISHRKKAAKLRRYILWDCHNQLKISCLLHVEASLTYLLDNSALFPRLSEAHTQETQDFLENYLREKSS